jgi:hypothetical protein
MNWRDSKKWLAIFKFGPLKTSLPEDRRATADGAFRRKSSSTWPLLSFELFVAVSLCVAYFFLVRNYFAYGDPMSSNVFMAGSEKLYRLDQPIMGLHWDSRLSGLLMSGALVDFSLKEHAANEAQIERLTNVFGLYHTLWLLLLFLAVILALRHSLFINFGIFAGMMYHFSPASGPYFYPWDMPATLFFTLAVLFFERRQMFLMAAAICAGCFFKETVLVCALLTLFAGHWKLGKRILVFAGIVAVYVLGRKLLTSQLQLQVAALSMGDAVNLHGVFSPASLMDNLVGNLKVLFSPTLNSVIFANAGTLAAVLVLGWRRRFLPYMTVIVAFLAGLTLLPLKPPGISEVRVFMQILPLSLILLSERWLEYAGDGPAGERSVGSGSAWAVRRTFPLLVPMTLLLIVLSTAVVAWRYYVIFEDLQPGHRAQSELGKFVVKSGHERPANLEAVSEWFQNGYAEAELKLGLIAQANHLDADAINHYQRVLTLDTNSVFALNNLALLLATDSDPRLRDGNAAVDLAGRACQLTQFKEAVPIYTLAAAYAEAGRFTDAVATAQKASAVALANGQKEIVEVNALLLELYQSGRAYHQAAGPAP